MLKFNYPLCFQSFHIQCASFSLFESNSGALSASTWFVRKARRPKSHTGVDLKHAFERDGLRPLPEWSWIASGESSQRVDSTAGSEPITSCVLKKKTKKKESLVYFTNSCEKAPRASFILPLGSSDMQNIGNGQTWIHLCSSCRLSEPCQSEHHWLTTRSWAPVSSYMQKRADGTFLQSLTLPCDAARAAVRGEKILLDSKETMN